MTFLTTTLRGAFFTPTTNVRGILATTVRRTLVLQKFYWIFEINSGTGHGYTRTPNEGWHRKYPTSVPVYEYKGNLKHISKERRTLFTLTTIVRGILHTGP